jgi:hypothetical protein
MLPLEYGLRVSIHLAVVEQNGGAGVPFEAFRQPLPSVHVPLI